MLWANSIPRALTVHTAIVLWWAKSLYRSRAGRHFYGTENVFWAGFGPVGKTEKKSAWADYEQLLRAVFSCFQGQKKISKFF